ncbi:30S ribosomal protein S11 [bacterium]|jgi:small subunit ribosomal protein S11|nr:30S ribosomal protein S11 [bacterium]MBT6831993.1 30S ribosomal protein S11 [bacterium]MBT6996793.1 30S ribosomal protein S11 [bacterium]MBT7772082.1 30S ribosomal protein S11 [bacterium]
MVKATKKRIRKTFETGRVYVTAAWNNTIVTLTDPEGNVLGWSSPGRKGFKGARQSTPYAGQVSAEAVAEQAQLFGIKSVEVFVRGMGPARDQSIRGLSNGGLQVKSIASVSRVPHGGCRPRKVRKV